MKNACQFLVLVLLMVSCNDDSSKVILDIEQGEYWWGGLSAIGHETPYNSNSRIHIDQWGNDKGNQAQPLLISSKGRYVWSEGPLEYTIADGKLAVDSRIDQVQFGDAGENLRDAYDFVVKSYFPPNGKIPEALLFTQPQYNTWIELMYDQNEVDILKYAHAIIDNGYPPGVIMIDDNWQANYGDWKFSKRRFTDPKAMITELHDLGFQVMLWVCPFVSPDSQIFRKLEKEDLLVKNKESNAAIIRWWNGASGCLDLSNTGAVDWFQKELDHLVDEYGVDGFKLDAGDAEFYTDNVITKNGKSPNDNTMFFSKIGLRYPLNEYRASWKMAGFPLVQRLRDKSHNWKDLQKLIPDLMSQSLMGYAYTCPDMIGGGEFQSFLKAETIDEELVVRSAQVHALMPMMQFSVAPWRVLSDENNNICKKAAQLHSSFSAIIMALAHIASQTGEPIAKPLSLAYPDEGYEMIKDQFMLGDDILVAPIVEQGARNRKVILPKGLWISDIGKEYDGGQTIDIDVPLDRLAYFERVDK